MFRFVSFCRFFGLFILATVSLITLVSSSFYLYLQPGLPDVEQLRSTKFQEPLRIYSSDNKLIAEFGEKRRQPIAISDVPKDMINAFIAAEDNRFFSHSGVDIKGLSRAVAQLLSTGKIQSGGSTITMQVAKNFFLSREKTFSRKFNEILLALQIEQELTKLEILELYFNKIYLGNRAYGIEAAAQVYYGKSVKELSIAQIAMIAGLPKAPSRYNPLADSDRALVRRNWILDRMLELNFIDQAAHDNAQAAPLTATYHGAKPEVEASYLAEMARNEAINLYGRDAYNDGLRIYLTVSSDLQTAANLAVREGLNSYEERHGYRGPEQLLDPATLNDTAALAAHLSKVPVYADLFPFVTIEVDNDSATLFNPTYGLVKINDNGFKWARRFIDTDKRGATPKTAKEVLNPGDLVRLRPVEGEDHATYWRLAQLPEVQGALVSINPSDGAVLALVGGYDFYHSKFNRALQAARQPGSNFKPFIYLSALENGMTPATLINDAPIVFEDRNLEESWRPENSSGKFYGPTRLRQALYNSRNLVSIRLLRETGISKTLNYVTRFGFDVAKLPRDLSLALGSAALTPMEVATGYSILANGGFKVAPYFIQRIEDASGKELFKATPSTICRNCPPKSADESETYAERVADERSIYIMHSILKDVIRKGTGTKARRLNRPDLAGKTGTTNDQIDAWFSGFNTAIETTVWVGFDQPKTLGRREYGAAAALPIWIDYMATALKGSPIANLAQPKGMTSVKINPETGKLAAPGDPDAIFEIFREEYAPKPEAVNSPQISAPLQNKGDTNQTHPAPEEIF
ncbi:MAG: penicillin-binding protein 1A [Hahellaceae bacterium]|nr:penicillin-binding protein 1A [Hahellaceae bacterium]MCP5168829.1 penicillin-binding protein 1A [Hahellaceae bacterium]